jgi:hypothetical protein
MPKLLCTVCDILQQLQYSHYYNVGYYDITVITMPGKYSVLRALLWHFSGYDVSPDIF